MRSDSDRLVLVVEDDAIVGLSLQDDMEDRGYTVAGPFGTCVAALSWLEAHTPDLAVLDVTLKDGPCQDIALELIRRSVPFLVYSARSKERNTFVELADCIWVEKPASNETLMEALADLRISVAQKHG